MALTATGILEIQTGGSDTAAGGGFDPAATMGLTDLAATSATGNSPVVTSASYTFVAGDAGAWVFVKSGTNWTPGWYQIASVNTGAATLKAAVGEALLYLNGTVWGLNTTAGCATTATPSSGSFTMDYSIQAAAQYSYTDLACAGAGSTVTGGSGHAFGKQDVGNYIYVASGTNLNAGYYRIVSVSTVTATLDRAVSTGACSNGAAYIGGALASPGQAAYIIANGGYAGGTGVSHRVWAKTGTYAIASGTANTAGKSVNLSTAATSTVFMIWRGYETIRGDDTGTRPTFQASSLNGTIFTYSSTYCGIENIVFDGNDETSSLGLTLTGSRLYAYKCKATRCKAGGIVTTTTEGILLGCEASLCNSVAALQSTAMIGCYSHDHGAIATCDAFKLTGTSFAGIAAFCVADTITGSGSGFNVVGSRNAVFLNCYAYGCGGDGFTLDSCLVPLCVNCLAEQNTGEGYGTVTGHQGVLLINCASDAETGGDYAIANIIGYHIASFIGGAAITASPTVDAANGDFRLNATANAGALLRAAGFPGLLPGLSAVGAVDIGALQHADPAGGSGGHMGYPLIVRAGDFIE